MKNNILTVFFLAFIINSSLFSEGTSTNAIFANGGDVSWLPEMEKESNFQFYNDNGVTQDCFQILKDHGINTIRLRIWVNPNMTDWKNGHCSTAETVAMAVRAQKWGMRVMIDFHYSDTWADPSHQAKPAAWVGHDFATLLNDLYNYTYGVMIALDTVGVTPEWVQLGNETSGGMIYPEGSTSNWPQLAQLINKGYDAVKAVSPGTKVVLHIDQGNNNSRFRTWFDNAKTYGAKYDVIGMSYYPYWLSGSPDYTLSINNLGNNLNDMVTRYGKEVMVVETGGLDTNAQNTYDMLTAVVNKVKAVPNNSGLGVIYWEPEGARSWSGYALSAWGSNGRPTVALDAFNNLTATDSPSESKLVMKQNFQNHTLNFNTDRLKIEILSMNGSILESVSNANSISTSNLSKGFYLIKASITNSNNSTVFKFICN
jgi:arabinogalactan endo-1,4-beta-galactosidase